MSCEKKVHQSPFKYRPAVILTSPRNTIKTLLSPRRSQNHSGFNILSPLGKLSPRRCKKDVTVKITTTQKKNDFNFREMFPVSLRNSPETSTNSSPVSKFMPYFLRRSPKKEIQEVNHAALLKYGPKLNHYQIIAKGEFSTVVLAKNNRDKIAVKIVEAPYKKMLFRQSLAVNFDHPCVIKILDVINHDDTHYGLVLMALESTVSLYDFISWTDPRPVIPKDMRIKLMKNLASGIEYIHSLGLIHLNIKPSNALVDVKNESCKLSDFSTSLIEGTFANRSKEYLNDSVAYAAPEVLIGATPRKSCDIYSFGIVLWEILARKKPYEGIVLEEIKLRVTKTNERPRGGIYENKYSEIYQACWSTEPKKRPSARSITQSLSNIL